MIPKLKALGLALAATLALTAVVASAASAQFTSNSEHTILSGAQEGNLVFTAGEGSLSITCENETFSGTSASTNAGDWDIFPSISGCKDDFGRTIHIDSSKLKFTFTNTGATHISGTLTLTVTTSGSVVCTVHVVSPQTTNSITYHNLGGTSGVSITMKMTDLKTITTGGFFNCGVFNGEHTEGTYTGTVIMTGKDTSGNAVSISVD